MKQRFATRFAAALSLLCLAAPTSAAPETDWINDEQERRLTAFAAHLADEPGLFAIKAELKPPETLYTLDFSPEFGRKTKTLRDELHDEYQTRTSVTLDTRPAFEGHPAGFANWTADIACGGFKTASDHWYGLWSHPNGTPPSGCPHDEGTSHQGTIALEGTVYVYASEWDNYGVERSTGPEFLSAMWRVRCTYTGSESGYGPACEQTLIHWDGLEGVDRLAAPQAESVLSDVDPSPPPKPGTYAAAAAAAAALVAATAWALHRWGQKAKLDPKGGREEPEARVDRWKGKV